MTRYLDLTFRGVIKYSSFYCDQGGQLTSVSKHYYLFISSYTLLSSHIWFTHLSWSSQVSKVHILVCISYLDLSFTVHISPDLDLIFTGHPHCGQCGITIFGVHIELQCTLISVMGREYPTWVVFINVCHGQRVSHMSRIY